MKITTELLKKHNACSEGFRWVTNNGLIDLKASDFIKKLIAAEKNDWADWLLCYVVMTKEQLIKYLCFKFGCILEFITEKYPEDKNPKPLIEAMTALFKNPTKENYEDFNKIYRADLAYRADRADLAYRADLADLAYRAYRADYMNKYEVKILEHGLELIS